MKTKVELIRYIETLREDLKNLAEDRNLPMDVRVHRWLWCEIQNIDIYLEEGVI
jgi:hypothetical protein